MLRPDAIVPLLRNLGLAALCLAMATSSLSAEDPPKEAKGAAPAPKSTSEAPAGFPGVTEEPEIRAALEAIWKACQEDDEEALKGRMDIAATLRFIERFGGLQGIPADARARLQVPVERRSSRALKSVIRAAAWKRFDLRKLQKTAKGDDAVAVLRVETADGRHGRMRLWLNQSGGGWKLVDWEEMDSGLRMSVSTAVLLPGLVDPQKLQQTNEFAASVQKIAMAARLLSQGETDQADELLMQTAEVAMPGHLDAWRWVVLGSIRLAQNRPQEAETLLQRASELQPDIPTLNLQLAAASNQLGQFDTALQQIRRYFGAVGPDADGFAIEGDANLGLGKFPEAAESFRSGLRDDPDSPYNLAGLTRALRQLKQPTGPELAQNFDRARLAQLTFEIAADLLLHSGDTGALDDLINAYAAKPRQDGLADFYRGEGFLLKRKPQEAADAFERAMGKTRHEEDRRAFNERFAAAMLERNLPDEAYQRASDKVAVFLPIASFLAETEKSEPLRRLIEAHRKAQPDDPWIDYFAAHLKVLEKKYDEADAIYAARLTGKMADDVRGRFREARVYALYLSGKGMLAYKEVGPEKATFDQLAALYSAGGQRELLEKLVAAHNKVDPQDADLALWEAEVDWMAKNYAAVAKRLREQRVLVLGNPTSNFRFWDRLIRSLIRTQQFAEAEKEAKKCETIFEDPWYTMLALAAQGKFAAAAPLAEQALRSEGDRDASDLHDDEDLAAARKAPEFKKLLESYPKPK